jgi:hypothetical protein
MSELDCSCDGRSELEWCCVHASEGNQSFVDGSQLDCRS